MEQGSPRPMRTLMSQGRRPMSLDDLPPPNTKRWVVRRKAEVVAAVRHGLLSLEEACKRYTLSIDEFLSWQRLMEAHGVRGLRATKVQSYRGGMPEPMPSDPSEA